LSNTTPHHPLLNWSAFAGFVKALPPNACHLLDYRGTNTPANCAARAAYVANALDPLARPFELVTMRRVSQQSLSVLQLYISQVRSELADVCCRRLRNAVPGWAITNGQWFESSPFRKTGRPKLRIHAAVATNEARDHFMVTQPPYRNGQDPSSTWLFSANRYRFAWHWRTLCWRLSSATCLWDFA